MKDTHSMTDQTTTTERMLYEDIDELSLAVDKVCAQINRLRAEKAELLAALNGVRVIAQFGRPGTVVDIEWEAMLDGIDAAIAKCEVTS